MLPYVAQGAAQAVEDAAVLGSALSRITSKDDVPVALKAYELARKERAEKVQSTAGYTRTILHYPDGPNQLKRDQAFANVALGGENPDMWGDPAAQRFLWSFDVEKDFDDNFECIHPPWISADCSVHGRSQDRRERYKASEEVRFHSTQCEQALSRKEKDLLQHLEDSLIKLGNFNRSNSPYYLRPHFCHSNTILRVPLKPQVPPSRLAHARDHFPPLAPSHFPYSFQRSCFPTK